MSQRALVIGLGGTGQWIATYVKNNLLKRGAIPVGVRLLAFDTTGDETEVFNNKVKKDDQQEDIRIGQVQLDLGEYVYLGGNMKQICHEARYGKHPQISKWFQWEQYLGLGHKNQAGLSDDGFNLARGAGMNPQFGRAAIFYDLLLHDGNKTVGKLTDTLNNLTDSPQDVIDIFVIASLAGGTGAGMYKDIAHLTRWIAYQRAKKNNVAVRGFLVLPNTFHSVIALDKSVPQAFASVRELNRLMTCFDGGYPINYIEGASPRDLHTIYSSRLFDSLYLIDAKADKLSYQNTLPRYGVYPAVADCITTMLDEPAGGEFQRHSKNVDKKTNTLQTRKGVPLYSSIGAFTYILPVEDMLQAFSLRFLKEFLETYFGEPEMVNANQGVSVARKENVYAFLQQVTSPKGMQNSDFVQQAALMTKARNLGELNVHEILEPVSQDVEIQEKINQFRDILRIDLTQRRLTSKELGDSYNSAAERIPSEVERIFYEITGDLDEQNAVGELQKILASFRETNLRLFREQLQEQVMGIFDDNDTNLPKARLYYLQSFLQQMRHIFNEFSVLLKDRTREQDEQRSSAKRIFDEYQKKLIAESKNKLGFLDGVARSVGRETSIDMLQEQYLSSAKNFLAFEIDRLLLAEIRTHTQAHQQIIDQLLESVSGMVETWLLGDPGKNMPGVVRLIEKAQSDLSVIRQEKSRIEVHEYLTDETYEESIYKKLSSGSAENFWKRFNWLCRNEDGTLQLVLLFDGKKISAAGSQAKIAEEQFIRFKGEAEVYFNKLRTDFSVLSRLAELYKPEEFAQQVFQRSRPLVEVQREHPAGADQEIRTFVVVNQATEQGRFWDAAKAMLAKQSTQAKDVQFIETNDLHRCVVLSTADFIGVDAIQSLQEARKAYERLSLDEKKQAHLFPAEIQAVQLEARLDKPPFNYRNPYGTQHNFSYRVVTLLEDFHRLQTFVLAYLLDIIHLEEVPADETPDGRRLRHYILRVKRQGRYDRCEIRLTKPAVRPNLFEAMQNFIFRRPDLNPEHEYLDDMVTDVDGQSRIEIKRVDEAIDLQEEIKKRALEQPIKHFAYEVKRQFPGLAGKMPILESEFSYFLLEQGNKYPYNGNGLEENARKWANSLRDIEPISQYLDGVVKLVAHIADEPLKNRETPSLSHLWDFYENDFILDKVPEYRASKDADERDLGMIMHIIVWDYLHDTLHKSSTER